MEVPAPETLLCDSSYLGHAERRARRPERYAHWRPDVIERIGSAVLAVTPFTVAEVRFGRAKGRWGERAIREAEERLQSFLLIPLDEATLAEWVALRVHCERSGTRPGDNDLWIAATRSRRESRS